MADDILTLQLQSVKEAQQRARKAFFLSLLVSCIVLLFTFNLTLSQDARMPLPGSYPDEMGDSYYVDNDHIAHGKPGEEYKLRMKSFIDRWYYSVPLLGMTISLEDFSFIGPLSLFIFSFYHVSCLRNIVLQLDDLSQSELNPCDRLKAKVAILSEIVLNTTSRGSISIADIGSVTAKWSLQDVNVYQKLLIMPFVASFAALLCDIYYSYLRFAFTVGTRNDANYFVFNRDNPFFQIRMVCFDVAGLFLCGVVFFYCLAARAYSVKNSELSTRIIQSAANDCGPERKL